MPSFKFNVIITCNVLKLGIYNGQETAEIEGARISDDGIIETFHNDDEALDAANNGVAVCSLSTFFLLASSFLSDLFSLETVYIFILKATTVCMHPLSVLLW